MIHSQNCQCGQCRLIQGEKIAGSCAICKKPGMFDANDIIVVADIELFSHPECRRDWTRIHLLEEVI